MYLSLGFVLFAAVCPASSFSWSRGCTEPLVGEEKPQLSSGVFWLKLRFCLFFTLSKVSESCWRSHCWEEEKCKCYFKVLVSLGISTACIQDGSPAWILLWQLIFGISKLLLCVLQKTWLRHRVCFCFMLFPSVEERKWNFLPKAVLNHQFSPKQKAKWVNHKPGIPSSCS